MGLIPSVSVLISVALMCHWAASVEGFKPFAALSHDELLSKLAENDKQPNKDRVKGILSQADPSMKFGRASVKDLLDMEQIAIQHCNKDELDTRHHTCSSTVAGESVRLFCQDLFDKLVAFCSSKLSQVFRANKVMIGESIGDELEVFQVGVARNVDEQKDGNIKEAIEKFMTEADYVSASYKQQVKPRCQVVVEYLESVESIADYGKLDLDKELNDSLANMFTLYKYCTVLLKNSD